MSESYKYFTIPFACVPSNPSYRVWFATWSAAQSEYTWSEQRPSTATWVCCATDDSELPGDATVIVPQTVKCVPPPPLALVQNITNPGDFQAALTKNLNQYLIDIRSL
jgi:hypothetical protein